MKVSDLQLFSLDPSDLAYV